MCLNHSNKMYDDRVASGDLDITMSGEILQKRIMITWLIVIGQDTIIIFSGNRICILQHTNSFKNKELKLIGRNKKRRLTKNDELERKIEAQDYKENVILMSSALARLLNNNKVCVCVGGGEGLNPDLAAHQPPT